MSSNFNYWIDKKNEMNVSSSIMLTEIAKTKCIEKLSTPSMWGLVTINENRKDKYKAYDLKSIKNGVVTYHNIKSVKHIFSDTTKRQDGVEGFVAEDYTHLYIEVMNDDGKRGWLYDEGGVDEVTKLLFLVFYNGKLAYLSIENNQLLKIVAPMIKVAKELQGTITAKELPFNPHRPYHLFTRFTYKERVKTGSKDCVLFVISLDDVINSGYHYELFDYDTMDLVLKN
ncbi:MAG: hypothetical protein MJZ34_04685 [Paludibacteraceae bacterium]|nr:hypothetical protein [Paludibacteraceae bacterium]